MYNNLLIFLSAIFLFALDTVPARPLFSTWVSLPLLIAGLVLFDLLCRALVDRSTTRSPSGYFRAEKQSQILALVFYAAALHLCDVKYYLNMIPGSASLPALVSMIGLLFFFVFLALIWERTRPHYNQLFDSHHSRSSFILSNIQTNLPTVLPWLVLTLIYDLTLILPWPYIQQLQESTWGNILFYGLFLLFILLFLPPIVRRLWHCTPLPEGVLNDQLTAFCAKQNFSARLYYWPLMEGKMITAGVMGIVPGLRYILITPALTESLTLKELEAVLAHEIGHVKHRHMLFYLMLIAGFSLLIGLAAEPMTYLLLSRDLFYTLMAQTHVSLESLLTLFAILPLFILMLLYFRFCFGYFIRNFERQADLHVFAATGSSQDLIAAFEKIGMITGKRDEPSWHHFGIGQRIDYLLRCEQDRGLIGHHDRKVRFSLLTYVLIVAGILGLTQQIPVDKLSQQYEEKYIEVMLQEKIRQEPDKALWLRLAGDLLQHQKMEQKALDAYEQALELEPGNAALMNNLAWLLLTAENTELRDPHRALSLARSAVTRSPQGFIFDTLATAYWANSLPAEAVKMEQRAIQADPANAGYYRKQVARFLSSTYLDELTDKGDKP
ncbi:MAG: M48 family metalloprotease [Desulfobulbaceae bacterium]|uniref:M48 family metalloprotease n=1 Tax=Candidatus Desulfatifera sulfidica TaxID=2841691 RepID=A0A8J6N828_9BACT|nr:M48 family metalloprotease [Candidatus Desulfatifera sulfidica]